MRLSMIAVVLATVLAAARAAQAEEKSAATETNSPPPLSAEAQAVASELEQKLPPGSEARAMYDDIRQGSRLDHRDGWFRLAVSQTRYGWEYVAREYDRQPDGAVSREEFTGSEAEFARLDRDSDGRITAADFDWSENAMSRTPGMLLFLQADRDGNGKVTQAEFAALFGELDSGSHGFIALDDLRHRFNPAGEPPRSARRDAPSVDTLVKALATQEIGSLEPGPMLEEPAPDFTLPTANDGKKVTLSAEIGPKPLVLIFGNFTCGPFRSQAGNIEKLYERYRDRATFLMVYVREAHPADGWWMESNERVGIDLPQPKSDAERLAVARTCQAHLDLDLPLLVDTIDDRVGTQYSGMPNRLYLVDQQGRVAFKSGRGPFGFKPRQLEQALILLLADRQRGK